MRLTSTKSPRIFAEAGQAGVARGATRGSALNINCGVFRQCHAIRVDCGLRANRTLRYCDYVEPRRTEQACVQLERFLRAFRFQSNVTGGQETTPTITPRPQHRPRVRAIAMLNGWVEMLET